MLFITACNNQAQVPAEAPVPASTPIPQAAEVDEEEEAEEIEEAYEEEEEAGVELPEDLTPFGIYTFAMEKVTAQLAEADSFLLDSRVFFNMLFDEEFFEMQMDMQISQVNSDPDVEMKIDMETSFMGMEMPIAIYFRDGVAYMDMMGMQTQMPMSIDELLEEFDISMDSFEAVDFGLHDIISQEMHAIHEGKELTFVISAATVNNAMEEAAQMLQLLEFDGSEMDIQFNNVVLVAIIDEDYNIKSTEMMTSFVLTSEGEVIIIDMSIMSAFVQIGGVTIDFPDNLADFIQF